MSEDRDKGIEALRQIYRYADQEKRIAARQADEAKAAKDYRASDRHYMYSKAMAKICGKVSALARRTFLVDVTVEESSTGQESNGRS